METPPQQPVEVKPARQRRVARFLAVGLLLLAAVWVSSVATPHSAGPARGSQLRGSERAVPATQPSLRVATYNIHSGNDADGKHDLKRTAEALRGFDLIGLNEVRGNEEAAEDQASRLGELLGMPSLFVPTERRWGKDDFGNGLLCRLPVKRWERVEMPRSMRRGYRNYLLSEVNVAGASVWVMTTHLDRGKDRAVQLGIVYQVFKDLQGPAVLMGDLNTERGDAGLKAFLNDPAIVDAVGKAAGAKDTRERIDWIFAKGLKVLDGGIVDNGASDHPLVWAELSLSPPTRQ